MKKPNQNYWFRSKSYDAIKNMEDPDDLYYDDMDSIVRGLEGTTLLYRENNNCQEEM